MASVLVHVFTKRKNESENQMDRNLKVTYFLLSSVRGGSEDKFIYMLLELAVLTRANMNRANIQEATVDMLAKNIVLKINWTGESSRHVIVFSAVIFYE